MSAFESDFKIKINSIRFKLAYVRAFFFPRKLEIRPIDFTESYG